MKKKHPVALVKAASALMDSIEPAHERPAPSDALQQATASLAALIHSEGYDSSETLSLLEGAAATSSRAVVFTAQPAAVAAGLQAVTAMLSRMGHSVYRNFVRRSLTSPNR